MLRSGRTQPHIIVKIWYSKTFVPATFEYDADCLCIEESCQNDSPSCSSVASPSHLRAGVTPSELSCQSSLHDRASSSHRYSCLTVAISTIRKVATAFAPSRSSAEQVSPCFRAASRRLRRQHLCTASARQSDSADGGEPAERPDATESIDDEWRQRRWGSLWTSLAEQDRSWAVHSYSGGDFDSGSTSTIDDGWDIDERMVHSGASWATRTITLSPSSSQQTWMHGKRAVCSFTGMSIEPCSFPSVCLLPLYTTSRDSNLRCSSCPSFDTISC